MNRFRAHSLLLNQRTTLRHFHTIQPLLRRDPGFSAPEGPYRIPKTPRPSKRFTTEDISSPPIVLKNEARRFLLKNNLSIATPEEVDFKIKDIPNTRPEVIAEITEQASTGEGLAIANYSGLQLAVSVPLALKGDKVRIRLHWVEQFHIEAELLEVLEPSKLRDDSLVRCKHFGSCNGCQFQMMRYEDQMIFKKEVIHRAYQNAFPGDDRKFPISDVFPSPLQYEYRTKITPHRNIQRGRRPDIYAPVGFLNVNSQRLSREEEVVDVDFCEIATKEVNKGYAKIREMVRTDNEDHRKKPAATFLIRETLTRNGGKSFVTDGISPVLEKVGKLKYAYAAGDFFQTNNSIISPLLNFLSESIEKSNVKLNFLVDTYCGPGLFAIGLSHLFQKSYGIEIAELSVQAAEFSARMNRLKNVRFFTGSSEEIFKSLRVVDDESITIDNLGTNDYQVNPNSTIVILDPPRRGSSEIFLQQLSDFKPAMIIYVSCNVVSQTRDLNYFLGNTNNGNLYEIKNIQGFDFFPHTKHIEVVTILERKV